MYRMYRSTVEIIWAFLSFFVIRHVDRDTNSMMMMILMMMNKER